MLACAVALAAVLVRLMVPEFRDQPLLLWAALAFAILQGLYPLWFFVGQERIPLIATIGVGAKVLATIAIFPFVRGPRRLDRARRRGRGLAGVGRWLYALMLRQVRPGRLDLELISQTLRLGFSMFVMRISVLMHTAGNSFLLLLLGGPVKVAFFAAGEAAGPRPGSCTRSTWPAAAALAPGRAQPGPSARDSDPQHPADDGGRHRLRRRDRRARARLVDLLFGLPEYQPAVAVLQVIALIIPLIVLNAALVSQWLVPTGSTARCSSW